MLSRVPGWEGEASPPTAKACLPRGEDMLSRWDLKVACPRKTAAKAWHPADITFPGCYKLDLTGAARFHADRFAHLGHRLLRLGASAASSLDQDRLDGFGILGELAPPFAG